ELVAQLAEMGYITSFCTAGYRCGRTGGRIMELLRSGREGQFCKLNAILTFREWLDDFASVRTKSLGEALIVREMEEVRHRLPSFYPKLTECYENIMNGQRDIYF
ncbi:MAG: [FeFe] hydrogenase H-cluster radical SAM maturase HydG, partial [Candidatus Omnitrophica bacterium]|nr:[FeFe] hydrogenase H-cluster radical SAM maturase HydG [Candidatus Omnitrophota bacterium]